MTQLVKKTNRLANRVQHALDQRQAGLERVEANFQAQIKAIADEATEATAADDASAPDPAATAAS